MPATTKNASEAAMASQRTAGRRCMLAQFQPLFDAVPHRVGRSNRRELRFQTREPFFPSFHECPHLRRQQPALEASARAVPQCAEYVLRREAVQQFAIGALHVACLSADRHSLSASSPRRIQLFTLPRGFVVRRAISSCERPSTNASVRHLRVLSFNCPMQ